MIQSRTCCCNIFLLFILTFLCFGVQAALPPILPKILINTMYVLPTGGTRIVASSSSAFQAALNSAKFGDIIELQAGVIYTGPFTLPNKTSGSGWIYVVSSAYSSLPAPSKRVNPADAVNMPKIAVGAGSGGAIQTISNSHHFRFVGIEFAPLAGKYVYNIVQIGNGEKTEASLPNNIVIDRCYIHGDPIAGSRRGVLMNGAYISVIDSYISDFKEVGADNQAIACYSTTGPLKIVNNYLEGAGENVIFGGSDPSIPNAVASDIEIRCNHFFKPLTWMKETWQVKNLLEFKNAQRVLVEGNKFENCWPAAQSGFCLLLTPRNQNGGAPWSVVQDITIRLNTFKNIAQGVNMSGFDAPNTSQRTSRILFENNLINENNLGTGGDGRLYEVLNGPTDVVFNHNTGFCTNAYMVSDGNPKTDSFVYKNNLVNHGNYGFIGSGTGTANTTLAMYFNNNWQITHNAEAGGSATGFPTGNFFPKTINDIGYTDTAAGDYRLSASSPYRLAGTDGKDLGADMNLIAQASIYTGDSVTASVRSITLSERLQLFPNPADHYLRFITTSNTDVTVIVTDILGRKILTNTLPPSEGIINTTDLPNGTYQITIQSDTKVFSESFVIVH